MDILHNHTVDIFAVMTSDCDFTPLAMRLRAAGKTIIGFGLEKTPQSFSKSCSEFIFLDQEAHLPQLNQSSIQQKPSKKNPKCDTRLMNLLRQQCVIHGDKKGWTPLSPVGSAISQEPHLDYKKFGFKTLSLLIKSIDTFETRQINNTQLHYRIKPIS